MKTFIQTEEQQQLIDRITSVAEVLERDQQEGYPTESIQALQHIGYPKVGLPKASGGQLIGAYELVLLQEYIASYDQSLALLIGWHTGTTIGLRDADWSEEMLDEVNSIVRAGGIVNYVLSERGAGSPVRGGKLQTIAIKTGDTYEITGRKSFATLARTCTHFLISAETTAGVGIFLIPKDVEGVQVVEQEWTSVAFARTKSADVVLDKVIVPERYLVSRRSPKDIIIHSPASLFHVPAVYLGMAEQAKQEALTFSKSFIPAGQQQAIYHLPRIQKLLAIIEHHLIQSRLAIYQLARRYDEGERSKALYKQLSSTKLAIQTNSEEVIKQALQICGTYGLQKSSRLPQLLVDVQAANCNPPSQDAVYEQLVN